MACLYAATTDHATELAAAANHLSPGIPIEATVFFDGGALVQSDGSLYAMSKLLYGGINGWFKVQPGTYTLRAVDSTPGSGNGDVLGSAALKVGRS